MHGLLPSLKVGKRKSKVSLPIGTGYGGSEDDIVSIANGIRKAEGRRSSQEKILLETLISLEAKLYSWIQFKDEKEVSLFYSHMKRS